MTGALDVFAQRDYGARFEWGARGAAATTEPSGAMVIVDVLSFSTAVTVAVGRGMAVYPHPWPSAEAEAFAAANKAACAVRRREVDISHPWSLSPAHLLAAPFTDRLVLPSLNGSAIAAATVTSTVIAGSLRNAVAVGRWLSSHGFGNPERPVAVIAAGERWPDGELRPALEDLLGAGAVIAAMSPGTVRSPEASTARAAWLAHSHRILETLLSCSSGRELTNAGYPDDVTFAADYAVQDDVPVLVANAFRKGTDLGPT